MTVRELKVSYLNSILPKVRETLGEKKKHEELSNELHSKSELLTTVESELSGIKSTLMVSELPESTKKELTAIREKKEEIKKQIVSSIENLKKELVSISSQIEFEDDMYTAILKVLISDEYEEQKLSFSFEGFLEVTELQEEFKEEYVYLFSLFYIYMFKIFSVQTLKSVDAKIKLEKHANNSDISTFIKVAIEKAKEEQLNN